MRITVFIALLFISFTIHLSAQSKLTPQKPVLTATANLLFKNLNSKLTVSEKNAIAKAANLTLSKDKKKFILADAPESEGYTVQAYVVELNNDKTDEIIIIESGDVMYFGRSEGQSTLFIKLNGSYKIAASVLSIYPSATNMKTNGYTDIIFGGPGFEYPLWKFNGKEYKFHKSITDKEFEKYSSGSLTESGNFEESAQVLPDEPLTPEAGELFKNIKTNIYNTFKNQITKQCGFTLTSNTKNKKIVPLPVDLNADGVEEIFIHIKTTFLGIPSNEYIFFLPDDGLGGYKPIIGNNNGITQNIIVNDNKTGYPDILTGKKGLDRQVWRWKDNNYILFMNVKAADANIIPTKSIETASEAYTKTLK